MKKQTSTVSTLFVIAAAVAAGAQAPAFEVASIKPNKSVLGGKLGMGFQPGRLTARNYTLHELIEAAYGLRRQQIAGGPRWMDTDRFDVDAKGEFGLEAFLPGDDHSPATAYVMLQTLLRDRFMLAAHMEARVLPVYALALARRDGRLGPKLHRSDVDCGVARQVKGERPMIEGKGPPCAFGPYPGRLVGRAVAMPDVARVLTSFVDRIVVDVTGLSGNFDLELEAADVRPPGPLGPSARPSDTDQSIFSALPEQLGLKLVSTRAPVDVLVIDRAERPTQD